MITLRRMTEQQFRAFLGRSIQQYAAEMATGGAWPSTGSIERSRHEHDKTLPQGLATRDHHLYTIELDGTAVGEVWLAVEHASGENAGYIFHLFVAEEFRRQGMASEVMKLLEQEAARLGLRRLALHLFVDNVGANAFYQKVGFGSATVKGRRIKMSKSLPWTGQH